MPNERIVELTTRMLSGEATPAELEELQSLIREHPEEQHFLELLSAYWYHAEQHPDHEDLHSDAHFRHVLELAVRQEEGQGENSHVMDAYHLRKRYVWKIVTMAAAACVLVAVCFFYRSPRRQQPISPAAGDRNREVAVKSGAKSRLLLPDGSTVWLNSDSKLTYNSNFKGGTDREVNLEGEAYFDVNKNSRHPFIVHTGGLDIRVLGTAFNVKYYPKELTFEATLISGKIEVCGNNCANGPSFVLKPHEKLTLTKSADSATFHLQGNPGVAVAKSHACAAITTISGKTPDSSVVETAWVYNKLVFDGETFKEITDRLERWFNVKIEIRDPDVSSLRFHASFENETIEEVLKSLQVTAPFDYQINDDTVIISAKRSLITPRKRKTITGQ